MMRWKCSGPLVQVNGVGFSLYFFRYRIRKSFRSFLERCTLYVRACRVRMLKKHLAKCPLEEGRPLPVPDPNATADADLIELVPLSPSTLRRPEFEDA